MRSRPLCVIGCLATLAILPSCDSSGSDSSVVVNKKFPVDPKVENGTAYDRATVDLGKVTKVVLPDDATVRRAGMVGKAQLFIGQNARLRWAPA
jgi:hypothetical protein